MRRYLPALLVLVLLLATIAFPIIRFWPTHWW